MTYFDYHYPQSSRSTFVNQHEANPLDHPYCDSCRKSFVNNQGLKEHYRQSNRHHYCATCDQHFQSANNLQAHFNSSTHHARDVPCLFRCGMTFVSLSAAILHLEGGKCTSGVDRKTINRCILRYDTTGIITDPSRLLTGGSSNSNLDDVTFNIATNASWNGNRYECYLCHRVYSTLLALNQHLNSPRHAEKIYICPGASCRTRFVTLSGLVQHIESQKCGVLKFMVSHHVLDDLLDRMGGLMLTM